MASPRRRALPDNLDPLVDTLSNVVGILVIVVALTQIQLGDALARVAELDLLRIREERARAKVPALADALDLRREAILMRTDADVEEAVALAETTLAALSKVPTVSSGARARSIETLREEIESTQGELDARVGARDQRERYAERLQRVPRRLVARLPDPGIEQGRESWILVRYGRVYLADREKLVDVGSRAIGRILRDGIQRQIRPDEFETVSRYLRKRDVGDGNFRWAMKTEPAVRVELEWRSKDGGLEFDSLGSNPAFRAWLAIRSPDVDIIRFHVWNDSFEAYLAAREVIEAAGFRGGWWGHEADDELEMRVTFGRRAAPIGPVEVD